MGALAPSLSWTSEDDQLLKNAVETGMSWESLSKGAVQFSQSFTFQELKDRWHYLTKDLNVSVEASSYMIECVDSASTQSPGSDILEHKGEKLVCGKRRNEGVQDCCDAMFKRVKTTSVVQIGEKPQPTNYMYEAKSNHCESPVSYCESVHQSLPNIGVATAVPPTDANPCNSIKTDQHKFEEDNLMGNHFAAKEENQLKDMSVSKLNDVETESQTPVKFDRASMIDADSSDLNTFGDSSTLPDVPMWNTSMSISAPTLPELQVEENETNTVYSTEFPNDRDANNSECLANDVHSMDQIPCHNMDNLATNTDDHLSGCSDSCLNLKYLEEFLFTDTDGKDTTGITDLDLFLQDFTWEADIVNLEHPNLPACPGNFVSDGQHISCYSEAQILLSISASNPELPISCNSNAQMLASIPATIIPESHASCSSEPQLIPAANPELPIACVLEPSIPTADPELHISCAPEARTVPDVPEPDFPELCDGVICCVLNTEDKEIPNNDEAFRMLKSRRRPSTSSRQKQQVRSAKPVSKAENNNEKPHSSCQMIHSQILSELGINLPFINPRP